MTDMFLEPDSINYDTFGRALSDVENGKIIIFGIPKSGNVWLQSLLVDYFEIDPLLTLDEVDRKGVLSIHDPFVDEFKHRSDFVHGVCLIRDMRDIIVSYYHYAKTDDFRKAMTRHYYDDLDSFYFEWYLSRCVPAHRMMTFADEYAERGIPVMRYEKLHADPEGELARLLRRWGVQPDSERVRMVVENNTLNKLKKEGKNLGYDIATTHFRKGGSGGWKNELTPHVIKDINERFGHYLHRWGYWEDSDS